MYFCIQRYEAMNQVRLSAQLGRRTLLGATLARPTLMSVRQAGLQSTTKGYSWASLIKVTCDHGPEVLVLAMYFCFCCA